MGRHFFQLVSRFPNQITKISNAQTGEEFIVTWSRINGSMVTLRPELWRAADGSTGALEYIPLRLSNVTADNRVRVVPKVPFGPVDLNRFFDKGYMYGVRWQYVFDDPNIGGTAYSADFASISPMRLQSDLNNDVVINLLDYSILSSEFLIAKEQYDADLNGDQWVDLRDYSIFVREYEDNN